jgi:hypothetical protein
MIFLASGSAHAQSSPTSTSHSKPQSVTVPFHLDHNRILIDVDIPRQDGHTARVQAWVDNGDPNLSITGRLATKIGLDFFPATAADSAAGTRKLMPGTRTIRIGSMTIPLTTIKEVELVPEGATIASGMQVEINIPATLLRDYAILVDYPAREFTIATPGSIHFPGQPVKAILNPKNPLIQVPTTIDSMHYNLALDLGTPVSLISSDLLANWCRAYPSWPHMTGAVGIANLWGTEDEPQWKLLRIPMVHYGDDGIRSPGLNLPGVVAVSFPANRLDYFRLRAGVTTIGLMGAASLLNYRIGIDYRNAIVYFQEMRPSVPVAMNVVGLILRPESNSRYTILGVATDHGKPVAGLTMGQVWTLLSGPPGDERILITARKETRCTIPARIGKFL